MDKFITLKAVAAPLPLTNLNTDVILPGRYLKTIKRSGLGKAAFYTLRYDAAGAERPDFVLNKDLYRKSRILITGANFGCGSSREHAPWALGDLGIRCIIAPSFADIFYNNCFKNGILCIALPQAKIDHLLALASSGATAGGEFTVDLENQAITGPDGLTISFAIDATRRNNLLNGLDDISLTLHHGGQIEAFEEKQCREQPWRSRGIAL